MSTQVAPSAETPAAGIPTVAFLGPRGTFTEQALQDFIAQGHLPPSTVTLPLESPGAALDAVRSGRADYACVALESSVDGPVVQTEDALTSGDPLQIFRETTVSVAFSVGVRPGVTLGGPHPIRTYTTHPVAQAQVRQWVAQHLPGAEFLPATSNGAAAQAVAEGRADVAIAPRRAVALYGLDEVAHSVADVPGAETRFVLVGRPCPPLPATGNDRTGIAFTLPNRPASLLSALTELSVRGVDLSRISSRPTRRGLGVYVFHVGVVGHIEDAAVAEALAGLRRTCEWVRFLGSWPRDAAHRLEAGAGSRPPEYSESLAWVASLREGGPAKDGAHRA